MAYFWWFSRLLERDSGAWMLEKDVSLNTGLSAPGAGTDDSGPYLEEQRGAPTVATNHIHGVGTEVV